MKLPEEINSCNNLLVAVVVDDKGKKDERGKLRKEMKGKTKFCAVTGLVVVFAVFNGGGRGGFRRPRRRR
jgi:hypothetical protein